MLIIFILLYIVLKMFYDPIEKFGIHEKNYTQE
jgi:hypothetical protein